MTTTTELTLYRRLSAADRAAYDWIANDRTRTPRQRETALYRVLGCTWAFDITDDDCNSPVYTLDMWASDAIDGRVYRRKRGPDVRWAFRLPSGRVLEVRPMYETTEAHLAWVREWCGPDAASPENLLAQSNWQHADHYDLSVYETARHPRPMAVGWFNGYDSPVVTTGDQGLTDEVVEKLWSIHRDKATAFQGMPWCGCCRRPLTDEVSIKLGVGPDCARLLGIPHRLTTARAVEIRHSDAEVTR